MAGGLVQISEPGARGPQEVCAPGRAAGIDLGTTYSLVATVRDGRPECLTDGDGRAAVPSVVHYGKDGSEVGWGARDKAATSPLDTIVSVKRFMGRGLEDAELRKRAGTYEFAEASEGMVRFYAGGRPVTPVEVSADILRVLRARAEEALGGTLSGVVVTVPAYFDDAQRQATKDAGKIAGLNVVRLLNEPTAAALAYGLDKKKEGSFAVYDLGGGTFDISILHLDDGVFEVKATCGDTALGGDDIDQAIAQWILGAPSDDPGAWRRALDDARVAKEALTEAASTQVRGKTLDRKQLAELAAPVLQRTAGPCKRALKDAAIDPKDLDGVVLVGGLTRMLAVRELVREIFGREPLADLDPDQVVALGAAVQADMLVGSGPRDDVLLLDVVPLSLGVETVGGVVEKILPRNSTIPAGAQQVFTTGADGQTAMDVHVLQGERELVDQCRSLARFKLRGIPPLPAGLGRVEITFQVDADGILTVAAKEQVTGIEQKVQVKATYGLTDDDVERMLIDSYENAEEDVRERMLREERMQAEEILLSLGKALCDDVSLLEDGERDKIEGAARKLRTATQKTDYQAIRHLRERLDQTSAAFAQRRMDAAIRRAIQGRHLDEAAR